MHTLFYLVSYTLYIDIIPNKFTIYDKLCLDPPNPPQKKKLWICLNEID